MKNIAILNLVFTGVTIIGAMAAVDTVTLGVGVLISWGLTITLSILALRKK